VVRKIVPEMVMGFIAEAKGYVPAILHGIEEFQADHTQVDKLEEAYRLIHIIKGTSSMVGLPELSHIAQQLEETVEDIAGGELRLDEDAGRLLLTTVQLIDSYLDSAATGAASEPPALAEVTEAHRRLRGLPVERGRAEDAPPEISAPTDEPVFLTAGPEELAPAAALDDLPTPDDFDLTQDFPAADAPQAAPGVEDGPAEVSQELLEVFSLEAEEHLRNLSTLVPTLEREPANREYLQEIRRSAHTLKGCAAMVGFHSLTKLAHRMEDLLDLLYEGHRAVTPEIVQLLLTSTDALEDMTAGRSQPEAVQTLYRRFAALLGSAPEEVKLPAPVLADNPETAAPPTPPEVKAQGPQHGAPDKKARYVRIPIDRLDELVKLVSELVIVRSSIEQRMTDFARHLGELQLSSDRLGRISHKLETEYEASTLGGGRLSQYAASRVGDAHRPMLAPRTHGFDDLEFDRYTEFHLQSRALAEATNDVQTVAGDLSHLVGDFDGSLGRQARLASEIEDKLMRLRMVPLASLATRLHRTVRNVAEQRAKQVELVLEGEATELDKTVLESMADPLLHILRNAVDHGIEAPEVRQARGKPPQGSIRLRAFHEGNQVVLKISDNGAGLDPDKIRSVAVRRAILTSADAAQLSEEDLFSLIFLPGFSTTLEVNEISGRGVGLDVVKAHVHKLKGTLAVTSQRGQGATFTIRLPLTLAITKALLVKAHQEIFAIPLDGIQQILRLEKEDMDQIGQQPVLRLGGRVYPLMFLGKLLGLRQPADESVRRAPVIILNLGSRQVALVVDHLLGGREIVIKNLGSHLRQVKGVSGATLLGDGRVVLILNPPDLVGEVVQPRVPVRALPAPVAASREALTVMVVDDSPSMRRVVSTMVKKAGWRPVAAKDGLDALETLHQSTHLPDLLLLDIEMPRMDGYELLSTLKAQEAYANIPVVLVTSRAGEKHRRKALDLGASGYVIKPYQEQALLNTIRQLVREARQSVLT
jgi:chemosensory pili system protein ChpA (sensor histidine kinase/response regulator)